MPQITDGQAIVANNSTRVIAATSDVLWTDVSVNDVFSVPPNKNTSAYENGTPYFILGKTAPGSSLSGKWELTLSAPFALPSGTVYYAITDDFYPNSGAPMIPYGVVDTRLLVNLAIAMLDAAIGNISGGGGGGGGTGNVLYHTKTIAGGDVGVVTVHMDFSPALTELPLFVGRPVVIKTSSGQNNIDAISIDTIALSGYNVNLSGPAVSGQKISNCYIPAP